MKIKNDPDFSRTAYFLLLIFFIAPIISFSQNKKLKLMHNEVPDDKYVPVSLERMDRTPAYTYKSSNFFTTQVNIDSNGNNIVGDAGNETSIAVDPTDPNRIVIGWRQFNSINNNFRQAGYAYSTNGGQTWTNPGVIEPGVFRSDPVLSFDADGNFYYNSLKVVNNSNFQCTVFRISDNGTAWDSGIFAQGGDKQWMEIDRTNGAGKDNIYASWSPGISACTGAFTRSTNGGDSYENCSSGHRLSWGTIAVGPDGNLYAVGISTNSIAVRKSSNAQNAGSNISWSSPVTVDLGGNLDGWSPINPAGLLGQAWIAVDKSNGTGHGNVYVLASVKRNSNSDPGDVMFARSTNGGQTFDAPIRINNDTGTSNYQWFGTMSVAPNGRIDAVWLDTRDAPSSTPHKSALYYSYSTDQGQTWSANEKLSASFNPHIGYPNQQKMGDYFDMISDNNGAHLAWANTLNGGEDVYYAHITPSSAGIRSFSIDNFRIKSYPNPFSEETTISFSLDKKETVKIEIYDIMGRKIRTLLNKSLDAGTHQVKWHGDNASGTRLPKGFYLCELSTKNHKQAYKLMKK